ncbi:hypothetical protein ACQP2C_00020 [Micromonospora zamorensis]|uniref:hypothetical protein n=1 Tax=Micromonospora zamorensis TaxID=709883 RepID=UPI003D97562E
MSPATASALSRIAPLDLEHALDVYAARLKDMTDAQLTEERHRLEGQWPLGEPHRLANAEFEVRLAVQHDIDSGYAALVAEMAPPTRWNATTPGGAQ